jgi:hypothetical protein
MVPDPAPVAWAKAAVQKLLNATVRAAEISHVLLIFILPTPSLSKKVKTECSPVSAMDVFRSELLPS